MSQQEVLEVLDYDIGRTPKEIRERIGLSPGSVSGELSLLLKKKLVWRDTHFRYRKVKDI